MFMRVKLISAFRRVHNTLHNGASDARGRERGGESSYGK